ncbi:MAG: hypothetical protein KME64_23030 [Scytonematopsis contorta HA4267-MV1]|jgi:hypothetical protein|nr:hypothetical protein [Scytonematopsis contorta HA4267-MV1]
MKRKVVIKICDLKCLEVVTEPSQIYGGAAGNDTKPNSEEPTLGSKVPSGLWNFS